MFRRVLWSATVRVRGTQNVLNHPQWANPNTGFTDPDFMTIRDYVPNRAPRTVQLGTRFVF